MSLDKQEAHRFANIGRGLAVARKHYRRELGYSLVSYEVNQEDRPVVQEPKQEANTNHRRTPMVWGQRRSNARGNAK